MDSFGAYLRAARKEAGLTIESVAVSLALTKSYISKVERGKRTLPFARAYEVATLLELDVWECIARLSVARGHVVLPSGAHHERVRTALRHIYEGLQL